MKICYFKIAELDFCYHYYLFVIKKKDSMKHDIAHTIISLFRNQGSSRRQMTVKLLYRVSGIGALCIERYEINYNCSLQIERIYRGISKKPAKCK